MQTFAKTAELYIEKHEQSWKNSKHAAQWTATLNTHANPVFGSLVVRDVTAAHVIKALEPIWTSAAPQADTEADALHAGVKPAAGRRCLFAEIHRDRRRAVNLKWTSKDDLEFAMDSKDIAFAKTPAEPTPALLLRIDSVIRMTGLGRLTIYRLMSAEQFPAPVGLTTRVVAWRRTDLERWNDARPSAAH